MNKSQWSDISKHATHLVHNLNECWRRRLKKDFQVESFLELEFEVHFQKLCLPIARNAQGGAKKRYAGKVRNAQGEKLYFVGMEYVRSDWTDLSKNFQYQLYEMLFNEQEVDQFIKEYIKDLKGGKYNNDLVYHKSLRKKVHEYTKTKPPHVKAALMLGKEVKQVSYIMTKRGPVPIQLEHDDIDFDHYIYKQIRPIADSVLPLLGKSFETLCGGRQLSLFEM